MAHYRLTIMAPVLVSTLLVAGCGQSFNELERDFVGTADRLSLLPMTPVEAMPNTGGARYEGTAFVGFGSQGFGSTASKITLDANFANQHVNGLMHDWALDRDNRIDSRLDGELAVFAGRITENTMTATATGQLDDGNRMAAVTLLLDGVFVGLEAEGISGDITGSAGYLDPFATEVPEEGTGLIDIDGGVFVAERRR